ncbi:putative Major Facilitator Superfamily [Trypanosoma vivax]|uniref:Lysosomal dipeptide transporter MFSD1 n=1 Tax=Trypanosoma vivax (strain Y486) TaxID=1055687 RepID=G0UBV1_TRYVY|nr:putative major facilitator superfamily [Trypanosoma vivax]KAH8609476.1 putative Major Facilitator Superfamily [Trypanosoma vivax]CCC53299.1 putative major facilitator superfamily [Trypanosoma vivax Y486]
MLSHQINQEEETSFLGSVYETIKEELCQLRWLVLFVACFLTFGSYYTFDFPSSFGMGSGHTIEQYFHQHGKVYTQTMNQMLYSVYSWPNTVLSIVGGLLIDKYLGIRVAMILFMSLIVFGSFLFWLGLHYTFFPLMVAARVIFGLGGESLSIAQSAYVARWFKYGRGMALAFGITISFSRVGSSFNFLFSPKIAAAYGVEAAALAGVVACAVSLVSCAFLVMADVYAVQTGYVRTDQQEFDEEETMKLSDVRYLPSAYWLLTIICVFAYTSIFPFIGIAKNFFEVKYNYDEVTAAEYVSAYQLSSAVGSPIVGFIVDLVGRNTFWLVIAILCIILIHVLFVVATVPGMTMMIVLGVVYSFLVSGLWPSIPLTVRGNMVGFSYGIMTSVQNIGLAAFPVVVGYILDKYSPRSEGVTLSKLLALPRTYPMSGGSGNSGEPGPIPDLEGYVLTEFLFIGSGVVALLTALVLLVLDIRNRGLLSLSSSERLKARNKKQDALLDYLPEEERDLIYLHRDD